YLFAADRRLAGVYNAAFENLTVREIADVVSAHVPARIDVQADQKDPRSYRLCSDRLLATGFAPKKNVATAVRALAAAYQHGSLADRPNWHTVEWMKQHNFR